MLTKAIDERSELMHVQESLAVAGAGPLRQGSFQAVPAKTKAANSQDSSAGHLDSSQMEDIAEKMNQVSKVFNTSLAFTVDKPTGKSVIKVMDIETEEIIRQIPPENLLKLMSNMRDVMGMLLDVEM